jgi:hypothetical protein
MAKFDRQGSVGNNLLRDLKPEVRAEIEQLLAHERSELAGQTGAQSRELMALVDMIATELYGTVMNRCGRITDSRGPDFECRTQMLLGMFALGLVSAWFRTMISHSVDDPECEGPAVPEIIRLFSDAGNYTMPEEIRLSLKEGRDEELARGESRPFGKDRLN